mgnify:CR=1 FL=1
MNEKADDAKFRDSRDALKFMQMQLSSENEEKSFGSAHEEASRQRSLRKSY